jgi:hypothetical protein
MQATVKFVEVSGLWYIAAFFFFFQNCFEVFLGSEHRWDKGQIASVIQVRFELKKNIVGEQRSRKHL